MEEKNNKQKNVKKEVKKEKVKKVIKPRKVKEKAITDLSGNVIKKDKPEKKKIKDKIKKHFNKYKKLYTLLLLIVLIITAIFGIYIGIRNYILNKKYGKYEKKMEQYGFSLIYNNESPESYEKVTRAEMVKMVLATIYNTNDILSMGFMPKGNFENDEWIELALAIKIIDKDYATIENYDEKATYKEALITYLKARSKLLDIPVSNTNESSFKNLFSYSQEERNYINDAAQNGLIKNSTKKLKIDKPMFKGEFNELVIKFVEKYNTIAPEGEEIVTKEESKPKNADMYPYILYSVAKEAYEYKGFNEGGVDYASPVEVYKYRKNYYEQVEYRSGVYYNAILNVDYKTINKEKFLKTTDEFLRFDYAEEINEYVDYVIANKITIEGNAKVQFPIFYLDGIRYRARIKLTFEIKNSDTDKNILLGDLSRASEVTYKDKKYEVYIDAPMGTTLLGKALLLDMEPIIDLMVSGEKTNSNEF